MRYDISSLLLSITFDDASFSTGRWISHDLSQAFLTPVNISESFKHTDMLFDGKEIYDHEKLAIKEMVN